MVISTWRSFAKRYFCLLHPSSIEDSLQKLKVQQTILSENFNKYLKVDLKGFIVSYIKYVSSFSCFQVFGRVRVRNICVQVKYNSHRTCKIKKKRQNTNVESFENSNRKTRKLTSNLTYLHLEFLREYNVSQSKLII